MEKIFQKIDNFLQNKSNLKKIIVIYGPTASGKTNLSIKIAKYINSEIISTDSRQIYKYMDIGTGKITEEEKSGIPHHMIDIINPDTYFSVGDFCEKANKKIINIFDSGKIPILVGGTGLYIDSLIFDNFVSKAPRDENLRKILEEDRIKYGNEYLYKKLKEIDPKYASELHPNNYLYVMRGIEVKTLTGISKLDFVTEKKLKYDVLFINTFSGDREALYKRINERVALMFKNGLLEEFQNLLEMGYKKEDFGLNSIGYRELFDYKNGVLNLDETIALVQKNSRNYAKRQLTWMNRYEK
ncbi:MAG: tRNA (adenosine(37)-N6)-dimethylallyltransferase MiaA [Candidatus Gracilibacteria bacterium]|nr:tRNA (adenosine(37)-N6)-dimethylallyltransferase MiaA [Candidatus Gracilibacteria bacterium]